MIRLGTFIIFPVLLIGCASTFAQKGSFASNINHKDRKDFTIDGIQIAVVPQGDHWSAWYVSDRFISVVPPIPHVKAAEIKAIELYSGCKVTSADIVTGSLQPAYLQAAVDCERQAEN